MSRTSGKFLIWSHNRGTVPYDIICILILAFIFLTPRGCFVRGKAEHSKPAAHHIDGDAGVPPAAPGR
ncbi:MAG: hypothetical protein LBT74_13430 [Acidobacteriota bacterium]|jgi:hypothetical protein|nr:hypothetical protein [Acidobacteriota bacterium]